ncbi:MAG: hypothetical protein MPJ50_06785 [Pirellulales bacterium]|nr:hypothetical protein [Pirellulales bacterium]
MNSPKRVQFLLEKLDDVVNQQDSTLSALSHVAERLEIRLVVIGRIAVALHGYERTTANRDLLATRSDAERLAAELEKSVDWQRQEDKEFCFLHLPTNCPVELVVAGELTAMGLISYDFPQPSELTTTGSLEGFPVVGLNDLICLKLVSGRIRDHSDIMELCKLHVGSIDFDEVLQRLDPEDEARRLKLNEIRRQAPLETEAEQYRNWLNRKKPEA